MNFSGSILLYLGRELIRARGLAVLKARQGRHEFLLGKWTTVYMCIGKNVCVCVCVAGKGGSSR